LKLGSVDGVPSLIGQALHAETAVGGETILTLWFLVLVLGAEGRYRLGAKVVLLEEGLNAASGNSSDGHPVPDSVLVDGDLTGHGLFLEGSPDTDMLQGLAHKLFLLGLDDNPPVGVTFDTVLLKLKLDSHS